MIYQTNFFEKEFRNSYTHQKFSRKRQLSLGVFLGLITFAGYFCLQTMSESVIADAAPYLLMPSYFSTLYLYIYISLIFNVVLFIANYEYMSFVEVMRNRWYPLVQLGYRPQGLIVTKLAVRVLAQTYIYTVGFIATIFLSSFLKFPFVIGYMISMYIVGLLDVLVLSTVSLAASLYFKNTMNARYVVGMIGVGIVAGKLLSGFSKIVSDRSRMTTLANLFDLGESLYLITAALLVLVSVIICLVRGQQLSRVYNLPLLKELPALTTRRSGTVVLAKAEGAEKKKKRAADRIEASVDAVEMKRPFSLPVFMTTTMLVLMIAAMLGLNAIVLACGYASPEKEADVMGTIPYVFQSHTMEPDIMMNDLAMFHKVDFTQKVELGSIVLFKDNAGQVQVQRLKEIIEEDAADPTKTKYLSDIDYYSDSRFAGMGEMEVTRGQIYGVFYEANRWLGAVILFANTTIGRLLLLLIPTFLVFFYDPIIRFFRTVSTEQQTSDLPTVAKAEDKDDKGKKKK